MLEATKGSLKELRHGNQSLGEFGGKKGAVVIDGIEPPVTAAMESFVNYFLRVFSTGATVRTLNPSILIHQISHSVSRFSILPSQSF